MKKLLHKIVDALNRSLSSHTTYAKEPEPVKQAPVEDRDWRTEGTRKAMEGAYKQAEKNGTLGKGFGGEDTKPMKAPAVMRVGKKIIK